MISKIFGFFLSILIAFTSLSNTVPQVKPMDIEPDSSFVPVLRFVATSDTHVKEFGDLGCQRIMKMIETGYAAADADSNYKKLDAAVLVGDMTDYGWPWRFGYIKMCTDSVLRDGTDLLCVAAKNHDGYIGRICRAWASGVSGDDADFHKVINGYHFIGLSASRTLLKHYTNRQIKWLDKELAKAVAEDPSKPVFVFQHEHIEGTVYGGYTSDGWGVDFLTDVLNKYPQVIDISGHSHYPANDPRAIYQDTFTAINDGGMAYYEFTVDGQTSYHPESSDNMAHMLLVEVDAQNRVRVRVCDLNEEAVMAEYMIDNVASAHKTKYNQAVRRSNATAPVINEKPVVSVDGNKANITVKPAQPGKDDVVFIYRLQILNSAGETVASQKRLGDYYKHIEPQNLNFTFSDLAAGEYTLKLVAEGAWEYVSEPVYVNFTVK